MVRLGPRKIQARQARQARPGRQPTRSIWSEWRDMKIKAGLIILLQGLAWDAAQAHDERCEAPPYGASMDAYKVFIAEAAQSGDVESPVAQKLAREAVEQLAKICKMKYDAADRTELYRAGFTPEDIDHSSIVMLTSEYLGVMKYVAFQSLVHGQQAPKPGAPPQPPTDYQSVSVGGFAVDGAKLAAENAKVSLTGSYILQGHLGLLYADMQAVIMTRYHPEAATQPNVPLLTDDASRHLRQRLLSCQTDLSAAQVGCTIKVRGRATMCPLTDAFGATHEAPCVKVEDGK
ncbi:MAG: hypothetical protein JWM63_1638 [Gammaproteobacteria bacterium]|jgi:hypothetical protein|nr:hypothetical protein [Gammaproteobacteria bacterium]